MTGPLLMDVHLPTGPWPQGLCPSPICCAVLALSTGQGQQRGRGMGGGSALGSWGNLFCLGVQRGSVGAPRGSGFAEMRVLKQKVPCVFAAVYHQKRCGLRPYNSGLHGKRKRKEWKRRGGNSLNSEVSGQCALRLPATQAGEQLSFLGSPAPGMMVAL